MVVSDHGLPSVTAGKSDGYLDQGSCLQVVPKKIFDELRLTSFTEIIVIYNNHRNRRLETWWKIQKKQMVCIDPEANKADFYHLFKMLEKYSFMLHSFYHSSTNHKILSYLPKNI